MAQSMIDLLCGMQPSISDFGVNSFASEQQQQQQQQQQQEQQHFGEVLQLWGDVIPLTSNAPLRKGKKPKPGPESGTGRLTASDLLPVASKVEKTPKTPKTIVKQKTAREIKKSLLRLTPEDLGVIKKTKKLKKEIVKHEKKSVNGEVEGEPKAKRARGKKSQLVSFSEFTVSVLYRNDEVHSLDAKRSFFKTTQGSDVFSKHTKRTYSPDNECEIPFDCKIVLNFKKGELTGIETEKSFSSSLTEKEMVKQLTGACETWPPISASDDIEEYALANEKALAEKKKMEENWFAGN